MPPLRITCPNRACGLSGPVPESMFETLITCRCGARFVLGPDGIRQAEVACPGCGTRAMVSASLLDRAVTCRCGTTFTAAVAGVAPGPTGQPEAPTRRFMQPLDPGRFTLPTVDVGGPPVELPVEMPHTSQDWAWVSFCLAHGTIVAQDWQHAVAHAWSLGSWERSASDWMPTEREIQAAAERKSMTPGDRILVADGHYVVVVLRSARDRQGLCTFNSLFWDTAAREWVAEVEGGRGFGYLHARPAHLAICDGARLGVALRPAPGNPIEFRWSNLAPPRGIGFGTLTLSLDGRWLIRKHMHEPLTEMRVTVYDTTTWATLADTVVPMPRELLPEGKASCEHEIAEASGGGSFAMVLAQDDTASPVPATVALQDIATGQVLGSAVSSQWPVICKTWNPECGLVAWLRHPGVLEVWQLPAGRLVLQEDACAWASARLLADPRREMRALFSADGRYLAVHDRPARRVRVFPFAVSCPPR